MQRLAFELRAHGGDDFGMPVADVEDAEPAEAIDILAAVNIGEDVARVRPLDRGIERTAGARLTIFEKPRIDVIAKTVDRFADDPIGLRAIDRRGVDEL
jgi:hypothetical protein